ncbi:alpha/beta hydrolase family protein [Nitrospinota bacterium]
MSRLERQRAGQQWILDYFIKTAGRAVHYEHDSRALPSQAKSLRMVSKHQARAAENTERLARAVEARGEGRTARALYRVAVERFREAQHFCIPVMDPRKRELHGRMLSCADRLHALADYPIERVEIPFEGRSLAGLLHLLPDRRRAPAVLFIPGMDSLKENYPDPLDNEFIARGMHILALDGPGQGESWLRGIHVTPDAHAAAGREAFEYLASRPEVDETKIGVSGRSFGSYWSLRIAAAEPRFAACAGCVANYQWDRLTIFDEAPIRFKQVFMAMADIADEEEFDRQAERYILRGHAEQVRCPVLMATGEFDPLSPLEGAEALFNALNCPKELWVFEDEFHPMASLDALGGLAAYPFVADWMHRALEGEFKEGHKRRTLVQKNGEGMY